MDELNKPIDTQFKELVEKVTVFPKAKAKEYAEAFKPFAKRIGELDKQITGINTDEPTEADSVFARDLRLQFVKNRTASKEQKDESKKVILAEGNFIQALFNIVEAVSKPKEELLLKVEKDVEIKEAAAKLELKNSRAELLAPYVTDVNIFPLADMQQEAFENLLEGAKLQHQAKLKREAAEAKTAAKQKEIDDAAAEELRIENEKLKKEKEKNAAAQKVKDDLQKARLEELLPFNGFGADVNMTELYLLPTAKYVAIYNEKKQAFDAAELEKEKAAAKAKADGEKLAAAQKVLKEQKAAADAKERQAAAAAEAELAKGDKDKIKDLIADLEALKTKYTFKSAASKALYISVIALIEKIIVYIKSK